MRAHDVGIGIAVAWARERGLLISEAKFTPGVDDEVAFLVFNDFSVYVRTHYWWCRGPVVEPEPLTDTRVAFGIAVAQQYKQRLWLYTEVVPPYRERVESMEWSSGWIDLDPR